MKIEYLKIFSQKIEEQKTFYRDVLELPVKESGESSFRVQIGFSALEIEEHKDATPYHLAFHIPQQRENSALAWLEKKLSVLKNDGDKIVDFPAWKAKSLYFYDADKNILEFISRRDFYPAQKDEFSSGEILGISEVGLATTNVEEKFSFLNENFGLEKYSGDYERFCAVGDDEGLFIIINKDQKDWIPTGDKAFASPFELKISVEKAFFGVVFRNERLELL
ncbi:VOC family protein [Salinimicrobium sp. HB62]|uniref:VOC family protein n=1 Tax=Salinimicrobium sp. HB62 TaxID=3077781 RepID=UPI002D786A0B|nr:VOC family protein [Salinimicrobium sp. HB62]